MPRRFYRKKRYYKKRGGRKRIKRAMKKMRKIGLNFVKLRTQANISSSVAGTILDVFGMTNVQSCQDWSNCAGLYDQYRVFGMSIKWFPHLPNDTSVTTSYYPWYFVPDYDDVTALSTIAEAVQYERLKVKNIYKPFTLYYKIPKLLSMASTTAIANFGWMDVADPQTTGGIKSIATGLSASSVYGTYVMTYYVAFKNRR